MNMRELIEISDSEKLDNKTIKAERKIKKIIVAALNKAGYPARKEYDALFVTVDMGKAGTWELQLDISCDNVRRVG